MTVNFSPETMETKRQWNTILKVFKFENCQPTILQSVKIIFKSQNQVKTFQRDKNLGDLTQLGDFTLISTKRYRSFPKWRKIVSDGTLNLKEERGSTRNKIIYIKSYMYFQVFSQCS